MRKASESVLRRKADAADGPEAAFDNSGGWTLVDFLFPAEQAPVWSGSVNDERVEAGAKAA